MEFLPKEMCRKSKLISDEIQSLFDANTIEQLAQELKYVQRRGKISAFDFMLSVSQALDNHGGQCSLSQIGHVIYRELGIQMQNQSINERFNWAGVELVKTLFEQMLCSCLNMNCKANVLEVFNGIYLEDASNINLPDELADLFTGYGSDASASAMKLNLCYNIQGSNLSLRLKSATDNDQNGLTFGAPINSLWIRDLGYYKSEEFKGLSNQQAYYVSRLPKCANAYLTDKYRCPKKIDIEQIAVNLKAGEIYEQELFLGYEKRWQTRLIIIKLPQDKAAQRKEKMLKHRKRKGRRVTAQALALNDVNIYITNLSAEQWRAEHIYLIYTIRWQIEIMFKAWKTVYQVDEIKQNIKPERALFQLYLQLIMIVLNTKIFRLVSVIAQNHSHQELSQLKGIAIIKGYLKDICRALINRITQQSSFIYAKVNRMLGELVSRAAKNLNRPNANYFSRIC